MTKIDMLELILDEYRTYKQDPDPFFQILISGSGQKMDRIRNPASNHPMFNPKVSPSWTCVRI